MTPLPRLRMGTKVRVVTEYSSYSGVTGTVIDSKTDPLFNGVTYHVKFDPDQVDEQGTPIDETMGASYWIYEENLEPVQPQPVSP